MKILSVEISNIKGIGQQRFKLELIPNKPNILVAPNGFGKSSFSIAFDSLGRDKISLREEYLHNNDSSNPPSVEVTIEDSLGIRNLRADNTSNQVSKEFDIFVINSQLKAKATKLRIAGNVVAKPSLEIAPTILVSTIPLKIGFNYSPAKVKRNFGLNGKILPNISDLFASPSAIYSIVNEVNLQKFGQVRVSRKLLAIQNEINQQTGTASAIKDWIETNKLSDMQSVFEFQKLASIIDSFDFEFNQHAIDAYLAAYQLIFVHQELGTDFRKAVNYLFYLDDKSFYEQVISDYNTTRYTIKPKEDKRLGLIVEWPKAHEISNGQRDVLTFITLLMRAKRHFRKTNCILIIDEIFDYLDDANLISFQYFITNMIEEMKEQGRNFFPILMTHLDPFYFNHFCFNRHKIRVVYLKDIPYASNLNIVKLIRLRDNSTIKVNCDMFFFHYHPNSVDISSDFSNLGLPSTWGVSTRFHTIIDNEMKKYLSDRTDYDPLAICFGVRVKIEELLYELIIDQAKKQIYLNQHGTKKKLEYCEELGLSVPESYYLLGIIYNDRLHWKNTVDIARPIAIRLENLTIKGMIRSIFSG